MHFDLRRLVSAMLVLLCFAILPAAAELLQIKVGDRDLGIPLEGVVVRETSTGARAVSDAAGLAVLDLGPARFTRAVLVAELVGYETSRIIVRDAGKLVEIRMVIEGILEADELVVEEKAIGATDEEVGVSTVAGRETVKATAMIGIMEDVMNTVKVLPGVSYTGAFNSYLSVRGGEPDGLTHVMDGFVIKYPYHWGGGVSIFNPHLVQSVKLSAGIFSVRYGQATSGLLEINTVKPNDGFKWEFAQSVSTLEGYLQTPLDEDGKAGMLAGTRLTHYDLVYLLTGDFMRDQGVTFGRVPYIYDFYFKTFFQPAPGMEWYLNAFVGVDGIGIKTWNPKADTSKEIVNAFDFTWTNQDVFVNTGVKILVGSTLLLHFLGGYENWTSISDGGYLETGTRAYSDEFIAQYGTLFGKTAGDTFSVDAQSKFQSRNTLHHFQFRGDADWQISDTLALEAGAGGFFSRMSYSTSGSVWDLVYAGAGTPAYKQRAWSMDAEDSDILVSFAHVGLHAVLAPDFLEGDFGLRVDHGYFMGRDFSLNTYPVLGPRALFKITPDWKSDLLESSAFSFGAGIFSKVPFDSLYINKGLGLKDFEVAVPKTVMAVGGWEGVFPLGWRFKIEGYYKFIYDRFYYNLATVAESAGVQRQEVRVHNDGMGHAAGFDLLLDRKTSRYFDGMLSYSFIWARYLNPESDGAAESASSPRGVWYYPGFHRFNSLNLLLNIKPTDWFTLSTKLSFATGTPLPRYGDKQMFPVQFENRDGSTTIAEMYTRRVYYDDYNRRGWVLPLDFKFSFHFYGEGSKVNHEFYLGAQDVLSPLLALYGPASGAVRTDQYTGKDTRAAESAFSFPIISLGYRASY